MNYLELLRNCVHVHMLAGAKSEIHTRWGLGVPRLRRLLVRFWSRTSVGVQLEIPRRIPGFNDSETVLLGKYVTMQKPYT